MANFDRLSPKPSPKGTKIKASQNPGKYVDKMSDNQKQNGGSEEAEEQKSSKEPSRKKSAKTTLLNKPSNIKTKKNEHEKFSVKASLLDAAQMACNIVEITQDSTLLPKTHVSHDLDEGSIISSQAQTRTRSTGSVSSAGPMKTGPFSAIKENEMKKQRNSTDLSEYEDPLPS